MTRVVASFTMSLDGFVAGPSVSVKDAMGVGGENLHEWMFASDSPVDKAESGKMHARVGAVILGRTTFDLGLPHWEDTPFPAPSFVLTHEAKPPLPMKSATFTFVDRIESALAQARAAAGSKDVVLMGGSTARQFLAAGMVDEIDLHIAPLLLGGGVPLFDADVSRHIAVSADRIAHSPMAAHMTLSVRKAA